MSTRTLRQLLPNRTETRFILTVDRRQPLDISSVLTNLGESPEAWRGCMFGLYMSEQILRGMAESAPHPAFEDLLLNSAMAMLGVRVDMTTHPYTEEALALLEGKVEDDLGTTE